jgi:predicted nucleic acid-binding protein
MTEGHYLDTNVLLRFLLRDHREHSPAARVLIAEAGRGERILVLAGSTISELAYVLRSGTMGYRRARLAEAVELVLDLPIEIEDRDVFARAATIYRDEHNDWDDCVVAAYAIVRAGGQLASFDRQLDRVTGVVRLQPGSAS